MATLRTCEPTPGPVEVGDGVEVEEDDEGDGVTVVDDELEDVAGVLDGAMLDVVEVEIGEGADVGEIGASVDDAVGELDVDVGGGSAAARPMPDTDSAAVAAITDIRMVVCFMNSPVMSWPTATPPPHHPRRVAPRQVAPIRCCILAPSAFARAFTLRRQNAD